MPFETSKIVIHRNNISQKIFFEIKYEMYVIHIKIVFNVLYIHFQYQSCLINIIYPMVHNY